MNTIYPTPVVSVLMSVYNGERYLEETLDTLLGQTLHDFEMVVVDDGSRDRTPEILAAYANRDRRIRPVRNETNLRLPASLNRGLALCRAPLVARADADDLYMPEYLETQVRYLHDHPHVGAISSAFEVADGDGRVLYTRYLPTGDAQIRFELLFMSRLLHPTTVFRADLVRSAGGYDETYRTGQDYELWARLRGHTRFANQPVPLVRYRRHSHTIMQNRGDAGERLSYSVSQRLLSEYLSDSLTIEDAAVLRRLFYGMGELAPQSVPRGLLLLERVLCRARKVEAPDTVRRFRDRMARHFMRYGYLLAESERPASRELFWAALRWSSKKPVLRLRTIKLFGLFTCFRPCVGMTRVEAGMAEV